LSTIFPEVRLKRYLEMRGADVGPAARICALPALLVGLYYDGRALDAAWEIVRRWTAAERQKLRDEAPRLALGATIAGRSLVEIGREILVVARGGLARRRRRDAGGCDEGVHLDPLDAFVGAGRVAAQDWIARFEREWDGSVDPAFAEACY
ncbi:MAG: glutamate-cysteine ligase family protein, partial [Roseiarcus sp.]